ncbi:MAG: hypothetical protein HC840_24370 [Leptolyngbyaceae cyanobacterium RM2_2_4]|nr:hypothetical protein [bacterium]NJO52024.1 hypothetical protein [Leptolyngbyaceae cyanobacterium RM2_2_4]
MNVLIYSHTPYWIIHHAETIEIALTHISHGDSVYFLSCDGQLASCPANSFHDESICKVCRQQTEYSIDAILQGRVVDLRLSLQSRHYLDSYFSSLKDLAEFKYCGFPFGELVVSQIMSDVKDCFYPLETLRQRVSSLLTDAISLYEEARQIINDKSIDKVYVWNGRRPSDGPICYAAQSQGIGFEVYISGGKRGTYQTLRSLKFHDLSASKECIEKLYDQYVRIIGKKAVEEDAKIFFDNQRFGGSDAQGVIHVMGDCTETPNLDHRSERKVVIFTSSYWEYFGMSDYKGGCYEDYYEGIRKILQDTRICESNNLIVRWHPYLKIAGSHERNIINEIIRDFPDAVHYSPESKADSYQLIDIADVVITFGSTIGIEAVFYGKPSVLVGRSLYEDLECCYVPKCHEDLVKLLDGELIPLPKTGAMKFAFYSRNRGQHDFVHLNQEESNPNLFYHSGCPLRRPKPKSEFGVDSASLDKRYHIPSYIRSRLVRLLKSLKLYSSVKKLASLMQESFFC